MLIVQEDGKTGEPTPTKINTKANVKGTGSKQTAQAQAPAPAGGGLFQTSGLRGIGSGKPMVGSRAGENMQKIVDKMQEFYNEANITNPRYSFRVLSKSMHATNNLNCSFIVITCIDTAISDQRVFHYTCLVEGDSMLPPNYVENHISGQVEIYRTTSDMYDSVMINEVNALVQNNVPGSEYLDCGACIINKSFEHDNDTMIYQLANEVSVACYVYSTNYDKDHVPLTLAGASSENNLVTTPYFNTQPEYDFQGLPYRADVTITLTVSGNNTSNKQAANNDRPREISRLSGFMDIVYAPSNAEMNGDMFSMATQQQNIKTYIPRFVITNMRGGDNLCSTPAQLLSLITTLVLNEQYMWARAFMVNAGSTNKKTTNFRDIGAIGYEVPLLANSPDLVALDTSSANFDTAKFSSVISRTFTPKLLVSLDVGNLDHATWYNSVFGCAAGTGPEAQDAIRHIIDSADSLTLGKFSQMWNPTEPIILSEGIEVYNGYYVDKTGIKRDIRDIDYLAILNEFGGRDYETIKRWSDSYYNTNIPLIVKLQTRRQIMTRVLPSAVITGKSVRCTFNMKFIETLAKAAVSCGLVSRTQYNGESLLSQERATGASMTAYGSNGGSQGLFRQGFSGTQTQNNNGVPPGFRTQYVGQ